MNERRRHFRLTTKERTTLQKEEGMKVESSLLDVSTSGMRIILDHNPKLGSKLNGKFKIAREGGDFHVVGEVVWSKKADTPGYFEVGIRFLKIKTKPFEN